MQTIRSTKTYCSDACRKKAARGGIEQKAESRRIVEWLRRVGAYRRDLVRLPLGQLAAGLHFDGPDPSRFGGAELMREHPQKRLAKAAMRRLEEHVEA